MLSRRGAPSWVPSPPCPWYLAQDPRHQSTDDTRECLRKTENSLEFRSHIPDAGNTAAHSGFENGPGGAAAPAGMSTLSPPGLSDAGPEALSSAGQRADSQSQLPHPPAVVPHTHRHERQMPLKTRSESVSTIAGGVGESHANQH